MKNNKGFCYEIFKNSAFWSFQNSVAYNPCSFYDGFIETNVSPDQAWHGPGHKKIIEMVKQDQLIPGCQNCYKEEHAGRTSRRQACSKNYEQFHQSFEINDQPTAGPEGLDYSVGNLCNLKCIICGPESSSSWIPDYKILNPSMDVSGYLYRKNQTIEIEDDDFLSNIKSLHFHGGGEPLLSDAHVNLLRRIDKVKGLGDVRVFYNTNGTQTVADEILAVWERCKLVEIYFSIDDIGNRFEYQRTGARWTDVVSNIEWFKINMPHNHMFNINCVWGYLNLYYLDQLSQWYKDFLPANRYGDPCNLLFQKAIGSFALDHLDSRAFDTLSAKFEGDSDLTSLLTDIEIKNVKHERFWKMINKIDGIRRNSFRQICPEWSDLLS